MTPSALVPVNIVGVLIVFLSRGIACQRKAIPLSGTKWSLAERRKIDTTGLERLYGTPRFSSSMQVKFSTERRSRLHDGRPKARPMLRASHRIAADYLSLYTRKKTFC